MNVHKFEVNPFANFKLVNADIARGFYVCLFKENYEVY